ncbi:MAG: polysaccharide biosynthesis/export family protein [Hyphomicrobiaceae bacterium]
MRIAFNHWIIVTQMMLCIVLGLSGCATNTVSTTTDYAISQPTNADLSLDRTYRLGVGDKLKISVYGEEDLSGDFEINALGLVSMPLIGEVRAKGQSVARLRENIKSKLADGYLNNPRVAIEVLNYRSFFVHGEVRNGGEFKYKVGTRLRDAIATAGGYTYRAVHDHVLVTREGRREIRINLPTDAPVLPGDNIRVPERFF